LTSAIHSSSEETARPFWRRRLVLLSLLGWTVFVGLAVWWLMQGNPRASLWIIHDGESAPIVCAPLRGATIAPEAPAAIAPAAFIPLLRKRRRVEACAWSGLIVDFFILPP